MSSPPAPHTPSPAQPTSPPPSKPPRDSLGASAGLSELDSLLEMLSDTTVKGPGELLGSLLK